MIYTTKHDTFVDLGGFMVAGSVQAKDVCPLEAVFFRFVQSMYDWGEANVEFLNE